MPGPRAMTLARIGEGWSRRAAVRVAITAILVFAYIWLSGPAPPVQADSIQDYSIARLCAEGHDCRGHDTSVQGLVQGRLLLFLLAALMRLGLTPTQHLLVFIALGAAAVVILAELARALAGTRAGLAVAGLGAWALPAAAGHPVVWNPTLASLPVALMTVSVVQIARSQTPRRWALAFVLGLVGAYHSHIVHLVAWPVASALACAATEDQRARATILAGPLLGLLAFDHEVLLTNAATLLATPIGRLACASILAGAMAGAALRPRWLSLDEARRGLAALACYGVTIFVMIGLAALLGGLPFAGRYFAAAVPALVILPVALAERVDARAGLVASGLVALFVSQQLGAHLSKDRAWTYADLERIDASLREGAGVSLAELGPWIRAPAGQQLVDAARVFGPPTPSLPGDGTTVQLVPLAGSCEGLASFEGWQCAELGRGLSVTWTRDATPWVDPLRFEACAQPQARAAIEACVTVEVDDDIYDDGVAGSPRYVQLEQYRHAGSPRLWVQRLTVRPQTGGRRQLLLASGWSLREAEGLDVQASPEPGPNQVLWIHAEAGAEGVLVIEAEAKGGTVAPASPAIAGEFSPDEAELVARLAD